MLTNPTSIGPYSLNKSVADDCSVHKKPTIELNKQELIAMNPQENFVIEAHKYLLENGYSFVGYHGTNHLGLSSIINNGLDPKKIGSNAGAVKGDGFYVAGTYSHAKDFAEVSTNDGDPDIKTGEQPKKQGDQGIEKIVRVYIKNAGSLILGKDAGWGLTPGYGDLNNDEKIKLGRRYDDAGYSKNSTEMVISPNKFNDTVVIPSLGEAGDINLLKCTGVRWVNHTV